MDEGQTDWHLDVPFWRGTQVYGESLLFLQEAPPCLPSAQLLFAPTAGLVVTDAQRQVGYVEGRDYLLAPGTRRLSLPEGSRIPWLAAPDLRRPAGAEGAIACTRQDPEVWLYFAEGAHFHRLQAEASYAHASSWTHAVPARADGARADGALPRTRARLRQGQGLRLAVCGDSISAGANASGCTGAPPGMPAYPGLLAAQLQAQYGAPVAVTNVAVGGMGIRHGVTVVDALLAADPDLVIVAYGMNDVGGGDVEAYREGVAAIVTAVRARRGQAEFVLVASMLGNPEWVHTPPAMFPLFRQALQSLCGEGVALADLTGVWTELLRTKSYYDLTGNGVNHPNDFGHRLYAQVLLELLEAWVEPPSTGAAPAAPQRGRTR